MKLILRMNIKYFIILILLEIPITIRSQSFEKDFIIEKNQVQYLYNEFNSYTNHDETLMLFNSNLNPNNNGGYSDLNDVWLKVKKDNIWELPINLSEINTDDNDLLLGVDKDYFYILRDNKVITYSFKEPFDLISEEIIKGFENNFYGINGDWETRRWFAGFGFKQIKTGGKDYRKQYYQLGIAPYLGDYGDLHTWVTVKIKENSLADKWSAYPVFKFFKGNVLMEVGYGTVSQWDMHLMYRF